MGQDERTQEELFGKYLQETAKNQENTKMGQVVQLAQGWQPREESINQLSTESRLIASDRSELKLFTSTESALYHIQQSPDPILISIRFEFYKTSAAVEIMHMQNNLAG